MSAQVKIREIHRLGTGSSVVTCERLDDTTFVVDFEAEFLLPELLSDIPIVRIEPTSPTEAGPRTRIVLARPMPDANYRPPPLEAHLFQRALAASVAQDRPVFINRVREGRDYWFFPIFEIGSVGYVVSKRDGVVTGLGSAWTVEAWLWGFEQGLVIDEPTDLRIDAVYDLDATVKLLREGLRISVSEDDLRALSHPPVVFQKAASWLAIGALHRDRGASVQWCVAERFEAFVDAAFAGDLEAVIRCVDDGFAIDGASFRTGQTPLIAAIENQRWSVTDWLLSHGASANAPGYAGMRPLHVAVDVLLDGLVQNGPDGVFRDRMIELIRHLLQLGADPQVSATSGDTPWDIARGQPTMDVYPLLRELLEAES